MAALAPPTATLTGRQFSENTEKRGIAAFVRDKIREFERDNDCRVMLAAEKSSRTIGVSNAASDWDIHCIFCPRDPAAAWCGCRDAAAFAKVVYGPRRPGAPADEPDVELSFHDALRAARLVAKGDHSTLMILLSDLRYVEEAPHVPELRHLAARRGAEGLSAAPPLGARRGTARPSARVEGWLQVRHAFGWLPAAAAYLRNAAGMLQQAEKAGPTEGGDKARKQLGYALHRTLSAEWLLRHRRLLDLPQTLTGLRGAVERPADSEYRTDVPLGPAWPALTRLAERLAEGLRGEAAVGAEEFPSLCEAIRQRRKALDAVAQELARQTPEPPEKRFVRQRLDAWTRALLVEGLRASGDVDR